jgi:hypothetical protein
MVSKKTVEILDDVGSAAEMLETSQEYAFLVCVGFDQGQDGFQVLHFKICNGIQQLLQLLPFGLTRNIGKTYRIVSTTKEQKPSAIISISARQNPKVLSPLSCTTHPVSMARIAFNKSHTLEKLT